MAAIGGGPKASGYRTVNALNAPTNVFVGHSFLSGTHLIASCSSLNLNGSGGIEGKIRIALGGDQSNNYAGQNVIDLFTWTTISVTQNVDLDIASLIGQDLWQINLHEPIRVFLTITKTSGSGEAGVRWVVPPLQIQK